MRLTWDPSKRAATLEHRGLDFADAIRVFAGVTASFPARGDHPEPRRVIDGLLDDRMVVVVWTPTSDGRRVISMRKANDREQDKFLGSLL